MLIRVIKRRHNTELRMTEIASDTSAFHHVGLTERGTLSTRGHTSHRLRLQIYRLLPSVSTQFARIWAQNRK